MYKLFLLSFIAVASCGTPKTLAEDATPTSEITAITKDQTITLALGEKVMVGELVVHFKEVLEDSRCPTGTTCFWQGRAKLLVETSDDKMAADRNEVIFGEIKTGEAKNHMFYKSGNTTLTATTINPYPTSDTGSTNLNYQLVIEVDVD